MDEVARIREKVDVVSLISEFVPLKKTGANFKALCPFHSEKTPSFVVSAERQIWHCFGGCGKGGDCFTFLMEYENLEFPEALRILAKRTGIELQSSFSSGQSFKKEKIYGINRIALSFYNYVLTKHPVGKKALLYLKEKRKISEALINTFMIGFSPKSGNALSDYLVNKKGYKKEELVEAGLAFYTGGSSAGSGQAGVLDFFRSRVMFPLFDHRGNCVGFSGRLIEDSTASSGLSGKYINTRETIVYHKGEMFFGLHAAKEEIKKLNQAILVEGEFDVISAYGEGIKNVVAVKGTALTESQASLLHRFTNQIFLCFDKDQAGFEATKRSLPVLEKKGFSMRVVQIQNGKDADESIGDNPVLFKKAVKNSLGVYDFLFQKIFLVFDKNTIEGKKKIGEELVPFLIDIENEIVKEHYLKKLAKELSTSYESILKEGERVKKKELVIKDVPFLKRDKRDRREMLEEYLLALIIQSADQKTIWEAAHGILKDYLFRVPSYQKIENILTSYFKSYGKLVAGEFLKHLPKELIPSFDVCFLFPLPKLESKEVYASEVEKVSKELNNLFLKERLANISQGVSGKSREKELYSIIGLLSGN